MIRNEPSFRRRLLDQDRLGGSFIKTPTVHATEILSGLGFDFVVIDEEHGPFDRGDIDRLMLATSLAGIAGMVRVSGLSSVLPALDMGADGVLIPHVNTAELATRAVSASRYRGGERGFSPSPRAGRYGALDMAAHIGRADGRIAVAVMIEHPQAVENVSAIAEVDGIDALFLGLGDLAVASGEDTSDSPRIRLAARKVCIAAQRNGKAVMATASTVDAASWLLDLGVSALVIGSDQGMMRSAAATELAAFRSLAIVEGASA